MTTQPCPACDAQVLVVQGRRQGGVPPEAYDPQPNLSGGQYNTKLADDLSHVAVPAASAQNLRGRVPLYRPHAYSCPARLRVPPPRACPSWAGYSQAAAAGKEAAGVQPVPPSWPQPWEGIKGEPRDRDDLLSLDPAAMPRRRLIASLALNLHHATLTGQLSPAAAAMGRRVRDPRPGDLVVEVTTAARPGSERRGLGVLLARRREWMSAEAEFSRALDDGRLDFPDEVTGEGAAGGECWYVQHGPGPGDVTRWEGCDFIAVLTDERVS